MTICSDKDNVLGNAKPLQFRVEFRSATKAQNAAGYSTVMTLVLEKGSVTALKTMYLRLRRDWYYDALSTPPTILANSKVAASNIRG